MINEMQVSSVDGINYVRVSDGSVANAFTFEIDLSKYRGVRFTDKNGKIFARTQQSFKKKFEIADGSHFACLLQIEIRKIYTALPKYQSSVI